MTQAEAWNYLADAWEKAKPLYEGGYLRCANGFDGLCEGIRRLYTDELIGVAIRDEMLAALGQLQHHSKFPAYCWDLYAEGAKARIDFCREQAAKTKLEKLAK